MEKRLAVALLLSFLWTAGSHATIVRDLRPVDEAVEQPDFFSFRAGLIAAVARRDAAAIRSVVHPDIRNTFGPDEGIQTFEKTWRLDDPASDFWSKFATVLALGGKFLTPTGFVAPYTFAAWPDDLDGFEFVAVIGADVRVRLAPSLEAATIGSVSFGVLERARLDDSIAGNGWTAIRWRGRTGFVYSQYVRSPTDYRAFFARENGRWRLTLFVAGD